jgi:hypothetical protein
VPFLLTGNNKVHRSTILSLHQLPITDEDGYDKHETVGFFENLPIIDVRMMDGTAFRLKCMATCVGM